MEVSDTPERNLGVREGEGIQARVAAKLSRREYPVAAFHPGITGSVGSRNVFI